MLESNQQFHLPTHTAAFVTLNKTLTSGFGYYDPRVQSSRNPTGGDAGFDWYLRFFKSVSRLFYDSAFEEKYQTAQTFS